MENNIKCTDSNGKLHVLNYIYCDNESDNDTKSTRGVVVDKDNQVIVKTFGYTDEFLSSERDGIQDRLQNLADWDVQYSLEGTLIRVFHYDNEWYISTHKKLNAFKSRWSCRETFGEIFRKGIHELFSEEIKVDDVLGGFLESLEKNKVYLFLLRSNQENRIVCQAHFVKKDEKIIHVGCFDSEGKFFINRGGLSGWLGKIASPQFIHVDTLGEVLSVVEGINHFEYQGLIFFNKHRPDQFKIVNTKYHELYQLRDNNPNLRFRYLELRNDPEKVRQLYALYPRSADVFDEYENTLYKIARMIYHYYVNRYIKNRYITLPREEYLIMKKCHDWYLSDRQNNRIFTAKIMEFLSQESPLNLYKMIRQYISTQPPDRTNALPYMSRPEEYKI